MSPTLLSSVALVLGAAGLFFALTAHRRMTSARRALLMLQGTYEGKTLVEAVSTYVAEVQRLDGELSELNVRQEELFALLGRSARNLGVVRFDAFEDMGGKMSFSVALLDDHANGVVITSINARTDSRSYAKALRGGVSDYSLSQEEQQAISEALGRTTRVRR